MAKTMGAFNFTGTIDKLIFYTRRDVEGVLVRKKPVSNKNRIKKDGQFVNTRKLNQEFGVMSRAAKMVRQRWGMFGKIIDYNLQPQLLSRMRQLIKRDDAHKLGQRGVQFSKYGQLLAGFQLNRKFNFDSVLQATIPLTMDKENASAAIQLPELFPGYQLRNPTSLPYYRLIFILSAVGDVNRNGAEIESSLDAEKILPATWDSNWQQFNKPFSAVDINLELTQPGGTFAMVLAVGISFGQMGPDGHPVATPYMGAGKILSVS
jgi:hypothetical protein